MWICAVGFLKRTVWVVFKCESGGAFLDFFVFWHILDFVGGGWGILISRSSGDNFGKSHLLFFVSALHHVIFFR